MHTRLTFWLLFTVVEFVFFVVESGLGSSIMSDGIKCIIFAFLGTVLSLHPPGLSLLTRRLSRLSSLSLQLRLSLSRSPAVSLPNLSTTWVKENNRESHACSRLFSFTNRRYPSLFLVIKISRGGSVCVLTVSVSLSVYEFLSLSSVEC
jgi:hypothetical protein